MKRAGLKIALTTWAGAVLLAGGVLYSYHVPFRAPGVGILQLASLQSVGRWHALHILSGSCGCSQKVMRHLLERRPLKGVEEEVIVLDEADRGGTGAYLSGSAELLTALSQEGFAVSHLNSAALPPDAGVLGIPLLVFADAGGKVRYAGGYGEKSDQDVSLFQGLRSGHDVTALGVVGCAVGVKLRRTADPFHMKY